MSTDRRGRKDLRTIRAKAKAKQIIWGGFVILLMICENEYSNIDHSDFQLKKGVRDPCLPTCC
jgi:hypothetical protein